ncbi:MAG: hypothetical protein OHK0013_17560 [Sandaracinaceae bacterium]
MARSTLSSIRNAVLGVVATSATLAGAAGCAPGNPGVVVLASLAPNEQCVYDPAGIIFVTMPLMDLDPLVGSGGGLTELRPSYIAQLVVNNNIISRYSTSYPVQGNVSQWIATGAEVELLDVRGARLPGGGFYRTRASGTIPAALGDQPGRGLVRVDVIPNSIATTVVEPFFVGSTEGQGLITARITLIGQTGGGTEVRAAPYIMPIDVCYGCLYQDGTLEVGQIPGCSPGQDTPYIISGYSRTPACIDSGECASGACVLGRCVR